MSKKKTLQPNRLALAIAELKDIVPEEYVKKTINIGEASGYVLIGVKHRDNQRGTAKDHFMKVLYAPISKYDEMQKTKHLFGGLFNGMFGTIVILHDPTKPAVVEKVIVKKSKGISNTDKGKVKAMYKDGNTAEDIANGLALDLIQVAAYIEEKLK